MIKQGREPLAILSGAVRCGGGSRSEMDRQGGGADKNNRQKTICGMRTTREVHDVLGFVLIETWGDTDDSEQLAKIIVHLISPYFVTKVTVISIKGDLSSRSASAPWPIFLHEMNW